MKIATAYALAELTKKNLSQEVYQNIIAVKAFGPDYIIPVPFDQD